MSIIFEALKKAQAKLNFHQAKNVGPEKPKEKNDLPPKEKTVFGFGINEDLTQPIKPIAGTKPAESEKGEQGKKSPAVKKELKRSWAIYDIKDMNILAFLALLLFGLIGVALVFYIFSVKMRDKYLIQVKPQAKEEHLNKSKAAAKAKAPEPKRENKNIFALSPEISLSLDGIVSSDGKNLALIDDKIVEVGDTIQGAKVISITSNEVVLAFQGKKITMTFK